MRVDNADADTRWVCARKKAYRTERTAERVAARIRRTTGEHVVAYGCTRCGEWHVGHAQDED